MSTLAEETGQWLLDAQRNGGTRILDPVHRVHGSYADGLAALAFALLWQQSGESRWQLGLERALPASLCSRGDSEFDSYAQSLLLHLAPEVVPNSWLDRLAQRKPYAGSRLVSNNWLLLRALNWGLRFARTGEKESLAIARASLQVLERQLPCGLFPDSPHGCATPICYHAKICAALALIHRLCPPEVSHGTEDRLRRGLEALQVAVSPRGHLVPYGRSRETLFAYGSAVLALRLGHGLFPGSVSDERCDSMLDRLRTFTAADGHLPAVLNDDEWLRRDWDVYVNNPDYNAYLAATLLLAERLAPRKETARREQAPSTATIWCDWGPLLIYQSPTLYFACSTTGEYAPFGTPFFADTRYAGLTPLLWEHGTMQRRFDCDYCWDGRERTRAVLMDARRAPWRPRRGAAWSPCLDQLSWSQSQGELRIEGRSGLQTFGSLPRWRRALQGRIPRQFWSQNTPGEVHSELKVNLGTGALSALHRSEQALENAEISCVCGEK